MLDTESERSDGESDGLLGEPTPLSRRKLRRSNLSWYLFAASVCVNILLVGFDLTWCIRREQAQQSSYEKGFVSDLGKFTILPASHSVSNILLQVP